MPHPRARRLAALALLVLLALTPLVALAPGEAGAVRLAGVSLLWWYAGLVAPAVAVAVTVAALGARPAG